MRLFSHLTAGIVSSVVVTLFNTLPSFAVKYIDYNQCSGSKQTEEIVTDTGTATVNCNSILTSPFEIIVKSGYIESVRKIDGENKTIRLQQSNKPQPVWQKPDDIFQKVTSFR